MTLFDKILYSSDEGDMFLPFLPYVSKAWKKLFGVDSVLALLSDRTQDDPFVKKLEQYAEVILVKPIPELPIITTAKLAKEYAVQKFTNEIIMFNDLDLIPLSNTKYTEALQQRKPGQLMLLGSNLFDGLEDGKCRIGGATAEGYVWKEFFNPNNLSFREQLYSYNKLNNYELDETNKIENDWYGEETAWRSLLSRWNKPEQVLKLPWIISGLSDEILDRANWKLDRSKLYSGYYTCAHMLRPLSENFESLKPLFEYIDSL